MLETQRLWLRRMTEGDLEPLRKVFEDSDAMIFYSAPFDRERIIGWIEWNLKNYAEYGYGLWALVLKESGECIGDCGLTWQKVGYSADRELEIGWHVRRDLWNRGLATEAALVCRDYARDTLKQTRLISIINPENLPSQAVARKIGMSIEREDILDSKTRLIFAVRWGPAPAV